MEKNDIISGKEEDILILIALFYNSLRKKIKEEKDRLDNI